MLLFEFSTYLACIAILLTLSVVLYCFKSGNDVSNFYKVKRNLATSMLFYALVFSLYIYYGVKYQSIYVPNCFIAPFYYYFAFFFLSLSVRQALHAPKIKRKRLYYTTLPLIFVGAIDFLLWLIVNAKGFNYNVYSYIYYVDQPVGKTFAYILYTMCMVGELWIFYRTFRYEFFLQSKIENFYSNDALVERLQKHYRWFLLLGYAVTAVLIMTDMCTSIYEHYIKQTNMGGPLSTYVHIAMAWIICSMMTAFTIIVFNTQPAYNRLNEIFKSENDEKTNMQATPNTHKKEATNPDNSHNNTPRNDNSSTPDIYNDADFLSQRLKEWEESEQCPYLAESLTISRVAEELKVSNRLLSEYLNNTLNVNFNTYINQLRINHIKKLLVENPDQTISDLAYLAGFTDASALTKVFKRFTGTTPSRYRNEHKKESAEV